jgi:hypothetical protein
VLLLMTASYPTALRYRHPSLGRLAVPRDCARMEETSAAGIPWAADNGAFVAFDERAWLRMVDRLVGVPGCLFVTVPDAVGNAEETADLWSRWASECHERDLPAAWVAQDGADHRDIPDDCSAVFIGGTTHYKLGQEAAEVVQEGRRRGLWVHMGRVNTIRRMRYAASIGCDSVDGTKWS